MKKEYYTPKIEEFHVGFEYELLEGEFSIKSKPKEWAKKELTSAQLHGTNTWFFQGCIEEETVRVKYLDKDDIESLGFKLKSDETNHHTYHYGGYAITHSVIGKTIDIYYYDGSEFVNNISIKNKSELKVLLNQLGITNNS